jgi:hypothetical protein
MSAETIFSEIEALARFTGLSPGQFKHVFLGDRKPIDNQTGEVFFLYAPPNNSQFVLTEIRGVGYDAQGRALDLATTCRITYAAQGTIASHTLTPEPRSVVLIYTGGQEIRFEIFSARFQNGQQYQLSLSGYILHDVQTPLEVFQTRILQTDPIVPPPFST